MHYPRLSSVLLETESDLSRQQRHYLRNLHDARRTACERARRLSKENVEPVLALARKERVRLSQARYRKANRIRLRVKASKYRQAKKDEIEMARLEAAEYELYTAEGA